MEGPEALNSSPTGLPFGYLANSLAQLLEAARRELEHDREAAKAYRVEHPAIGDRTLFGGTAVQDSGTGRLAGRAGADLHRQEPAPHHSHPGPQRRSAAEPGAFLAVVQADLRRTATCLRGQEAVGESLPSDDNQFSFTERNRAERWIFGSGTFVQAFQTGLWPESSQLATGTRDAVARAHRKCRRGSEISHER